MSPLRRWVVRMGFALAALGPLGGGLALLFGNLAFWGADIPESTPNAVYAGILLGTVPTVACVGMMIASPIRLASAYALQRNVWLAWPLLALTAIVGLADLSFGVVHTALIMWLWGKEGPATEPGDKPASGSGE